MNYYKELIKDRTMDAIDLPEGKDIVLTIKEITSIEVYDQQEQKKKSKPLIIWVENIPPYLATNLQLRTINDLFQCPVNQWVGKKLQIGYTKRKVFGKFMDVLTVRPKNPDIKTELTKDMPAYSKIIEFLKNGGSIEEIKKKYSLNAEIMEGIKNDIL